MIQVPTPELGATLFVNNSVEIVVEESPIRKYLRLRETYYICFQSIYAVIGGKQEGLITGIPDESPQR